MTTPTPVPEAEPLVPGAPAPAPLWLDVWSGIGTNNPVFVQMLGLCPTMAVSNSLGNGLAMGLATTFVLLCSSVLVSSLRRFIASEVRLTSYILIIATFVTVADMMLAAGFPVISRALGPFVALIVVNCIILGRQEAFASKNPPGRSLLDALGMGLGFIVGLTLMSAIREVIGSGTFLGVSLFGPSYEPWVVMILPPGGFLTLGALLLTVNAFKARRQRAQAEAGRRAAA